MTRLQEILEDQLVEARAKAGQKVTRKLGRGLRIEITVVNGDVWLAITREDQYPSLKEWETVTKHFPALVQNIQPSTDQKGGRYSLSARFTLQRAEQLKF